VVGRPHATDRDVIQAAKNAHIHEQIVAEPGGYGAEVREAGKNFSGGQRQRLAIARAIVRDSPILILDEPTANLDVEGEGEVMHAIAKLIVGRTVLMISHRLNALGHADEIIVLRDGAIAEHGSYRQLQRLGGTFAQMLEEQNRYSADRVAGTAPPPVSPWRRRSAPVADDDGFAAARSHSRWLAIEAPVEDRDTDGGATAASTIIADLRRSRRGVRSGDQPDQLPDPGHRT
jgi:ABC-type multidrug transport system ATPase subunit